MRKRFIARRNNDLLIYKVVIIIVLGFLAYFLIIRPFFKLSIDITDEYFANEYISLGTNNMIGKSVFDDYLKPTFNTPENYLSLSINNFRFRPKEINLPKTEEVKPTYKELGDPIVYIYNTHQTEDYAAGNLKEYNITPTVYMASFMLQKALLKFNINAVVEEDNLKKALNYKKLNYDGAYKVSYEWLSNVKKNYPTVKYFIDLHRDSVSSSITINDIDYAKLMFVVGMNHKNYQKNETLMKSINEKISEGYPDLMRKTFYGKNSRYNQHFDINTILIEVGGPKNTIDEVYNSVNAFAEGLSAVIGEI